MLALVLHHGASWIFADVNILTLVFPQQHKEKNKTLMNILIGLRPLLCDWIRALTEDVPISVGSTR